MSVVKRYFLRRALVIAACAAAIAASQTPTAPAPYTAGQAAAGRVAYQSSCEGCHLADLGGRNEAPPLAGAAFMRVWGRRTTRDLFAFMQATMPPENRGGLGEETYVNLV